VQNMNEKYVVFIQTFLHTKKTKLAVGPTDRSPMASFSTSKIIASCQPLSPAKKQKQKQKLRSKRRRFAPSGGKKNYSRQLVPRGHCTSCPSRGVRCQASSSPSPPSLLISPRDLCAAHALSVSNSLCPYIRDH